MSVLRRLSFLSLPMLLMACNGEQVKPEPTEPASTEVSFDKQALKTRFEKIGIVVDDVTASEINGLVDVKTSGGVIFSSPDGKHFIAGTLYSLDDNGQYEDVLAKRQAPLNAEKIAALKDSMIEFKADNEKYAVTVFTDITCGYCVRLHSQMQGYNDLGITVRYLAYPRQGASGSVADQMAAIWGASNPQEAMRDGKVKRQFPEKGDNFTEMQQTIKQHYALGRELGISGTPAIFLPNGELIGGYLPPEQLAEKLRQTQ